MTWVSRRACEPDTTRHDPRLDKLTVVDLGRNSDRLSQRIKQASTEENEEAGAFKHLGMGTCG